MNDVGTTLAITIFAATLALTFGASFLGRIHARRVASEALARQSLNRWLVGLSAGATANSGFVVTGAVGLGYSFGVQWLLLPLAWMLGDIVFWLLFPGRINRFGAEAKATTLSDVLAHGLAPGSRRLLKLLTASIILVCLGGYVAAQWIAGQKFLEGGFGVGGAAALLLFAAVIVLYTAIGGFRGSVYADSLQAVIRVIGTALVLGAVILVAARDPVDFQANLSAAGPDFLSAFPNASVLSVLAFVLGFAAAALGFQLGQPQMITRYLAGASPQETRAAWWIYLSFVQFTWLAMTLFGVMLRGVMPGIPDPEMGLSVFFRDTMGPVLTGIVLADIFATIAATSNSILVAMAQTVTGDLLEEGNPQRSRRLPLSPFTAAIGMATMAASLVLDSSVFALALGSVSLMAAGLAPAVATKVLGWRCSGLSLIAAVICGIAVAALWKFSPAGALINEAVPGMAAGFLVIWLFSVKLRGSPVAFETGG